MRFRRRTVIRERQVVVTEEAHDDPPWQPAVTWTARYDPGPLEPFPLEPAGVDELDPDRHVPITGPAPVFARLVRHPPVGAPWRSRLGFTADLAARYAQRDMLPVAPSPVAILVPRTYAELEPDTLAAEPPLELLPGASRMDLTTGRSM